MDRKDEIIQLQNEIMQDLLNQRMQLVSEDLWGIRPVSVQGGEENQKTAPASPAAYFRPAGTEKQEDKKAEKTTEKQEEEEEPAESMEDLKKELHS